MIWQLEDIPSWEKLLIACNNLNIDLDMSTWQDLGSEYIKEYNSQWEGEAWGIHCGGRIWLDTLKGKLSKSIILAHEMTHYFIDAKDYMNDTEECEGQANYSAELTMESLGFQEKVCDKKASLYVSENKKDEAERVSRYILSATKGIPIRTSYPCIK